MDLHYRRLRIEIPASYSLPIRCKQCVDLYPWYGLIEMESSGPTVTLRRVENKELRASTMKEF